jgi:single-stranded-DNA-specific exonuclease
MIGIEALLNNGPKKLWYDVSDLVFIIGPRINAAGRMGHGSEAVALLITDDAETATSLALAIEERNKARKETDRKITREALVKLKETADWEIKNSTVVYSADWHKGVVGIVASRVIEVHYRPTIVLCENQGKLTGSARSVAGFNLYDALEVCSPLLEQFGGHHFAAGLSLKPEHLDAFIEMFEASVSERITPEHLIPKIHYDLEIELGEITSGFIKNIARFGPFGPGNMMPVFRLNNLVDRGMARIVGENHLSFYAENGKGKGFKAIAFGQGARLDLIKNGAAFDLLCTLEEQTFNGKTSIQLMVKDIKPSV